MRQRQHFREDEGVKVIAQKVDRLGSDRPEETQNSREKALAIRVSDDTILKSKNFLAFVKFFAGKSKIVLYYNQKRLISKSNLCIEINPTVIEQLKEWFGEENVWIEDIDS